LAACPTNRSLLVVKSTMDGVVQDGVIPSQTFPINGRKSRLTKDASQHFLANISLVRVGNTDGESSPLHKGVLAARPGTGKSQLLQVAYQVISSNWTKSGHYATS
jgi:hypothetical protein